jgi:hypothetical protein
MVTSMYPTAYSRSSPLGEPEPWAESKGTAMRCVTGRHTQDVRAAAAALSGFRHSVLSMGFAPAMLNDSGYDQGPFSSLTRGHPDRV